MKYEIIEKSALELSKSLYGKNDPLPSKEKILDMLSILRSLIFPGFFDKGSSKRDETLISEIYDILKNEVCTALSYGKQENFSEKSEALCLDFIKMLPRTQSLLLKDVDAVYSGDPAAASREEIIFSYPGIYAIFSYRVAHELYLLDIPFIPRIITENAHSLTGIDINPGASIGEYFFIDHGTGIVIGETSVIGNNVKLYQGVTLGALSLREGRLLSSKKRHPTIEDNVTIYANATILGGDTVIGENCVIGGNSFITESVPAGTKVVLRALPHDFK